MSRNLLTRARRLAAEGQSGQVAPLFVWGKSPEQVEAEKAELIRAGLASPGDAFTPFTWLPVVEHGPRGSP